MIKKLLSFIKETFSGEWFCLSNTLSFFRIVISPFFICSIVRAQWHLSLILLFFAGLSDVLDGYLARAFGQQTALGTYLDPIADKIFILSAFYAILTVKTRFPLPVWFLGFAFFRELVIVFGALYLLVFREFRGIRPTVWGKMTTMFQTFFIFWLILCLIVGWNPQKTYAAALLLLVVFSCFSLFDYVKRGISYLKS